jgi:cytochrome P450
LSPVAATSLQDALLGPGYLQDPYPVYRRLREEDPVHWFEPWGAWILTRHADVLGVLREEGKRFSVVGRIRRAVAALPGPMHGEMAPIVDHFSVGLLHSDPPDHGRLRGLISAAFTPKTIAAMDPRITTLVETLLTDINGRDRFDLLATFAFPLPALVVAQVLGMPPEDRFRARGWADAISTFFGSNRLTPEIARRGQSGLLEARGYLAELAEERRQAPRDDVISRLVAAQDRGEPVSDAEILSTCMTFLVGGHETTTALITSGMLCLSSFPQELERLRADPSLMPTAVEEILRYESPNQRIIRIALEDVDIGGRMIRKGESVMLLLGAANRDPDQFPDPDRFDIGRDPNKHLAFAMGAHFCIGAPLARLEGQIALAALLERFPRLVIESRPEWIGNPTLRLLRELRVQVA